MDAVVKARFAEADYLSREGAGQEKHEFINGEITAMAGGSPDHALLSANLIAALKQRLRGGPCLEKFTGSNVRGIDPRDVHRRLLCTPDASRSNGQRTAGP